MTVNLHLTNLAIALSSKYSHKTELHDLTASLSPMQTMRTFFFLLILLLPLSAYAQEVFFRQLAGELCACLEQSSVPPEQAAMPCLKQTALRNETSLQQRFELNVNRAAHLRLLAERLVPELVDSCPLLSTLQLGEESREKRWSDGETAQDKPISLAFTSPKGAPLPSSITPGEPPAILRISGTLIGPATNGNIRLRTAAGQELIFELPKQLSRENDFQGGEAVVVLYRREWRVPQQRIVHVVVNITENS